MVRESIYKRYKISNTPKSIQNRSASWFVFKGNALMVDTDTPLKIPSSNSLLEFNISPIRTQYIGTLDGLPCYSAEVSTDTVAPEGMEFRDLRLLYEDLDEDIFLLAGRAVQIVNWDTNHQFCGKCGTSTITADNEMAKICPECGFTSHTRLSPAVITAIVKDGKLLMAKHARTPGNMYGLIAGFVEAGETLEEAVERETMEEVGLKVKNINYFGSQPWPFPNSLMLAFIAEYDGGKITVDGDEITDAKWFTADELPQSPSRMSIAGELIGWFRDNHNI
jgi:NAD+ diphosphatase